MMYHTTTPSTPDSAAVLVGAAGNAAGDRRNKTIMNCFRDRTIGYTRSNSTTKRTEANTVLLREPRKRPNKLVLLKSSSSRDLSRLMENVEGNSSMATNSTGASTTSSSASSQQNSCDTECDRKFQHLEKRLIRLEQELDLQRTYARGLEAKIEELTKRIGDLNEVKAYEKRKPKAYKKLTNGSISVQPSKLVAWINLSNLWKQRPTIETLKQQNIYNDEPCFDTEIEMVLKHETHKTVPKIVVDCCDLIEEKYRKALHPIEGIYRQCGDYNKIQTLRFSIDANDYDALNQANIDIHTLTGVLKLFLREIKSPLVSTNEAKTFVGRPNQWLLTDLSTKIETIKRLIRSLPEVNRDTMEYLFMHFNKLTKVPLQHISAEILAISVTPSIFHAVQKGHTQDIHQLLKESEILADCVKVMIEYQSKIFECTAERKRRISVRRLKKTLSHPDLVFQNML